MPETFAGLMDELQDAFQEATGAQPSRTPQVSRKWEKVARHILSGMREQTDPRLLAVELHFVFQEGHHSEIEHLPENHPFLRGWFGTAKWALAHKAEIGHLRQALSSCCPKNPLTALSS